MVTCWPRRETERVPTDAILERGPTPESHGVVIAVRGSVVNVCFPHELPALRQQLRAGRDDQAMIEVCAHLTTNTVRGDPVRDFTNRRSRWLY